MSEIEILEKIKSRGYWKITIRPRTFNNDRISLLQCEKIVRNSQVRKRGWPYPHIFESGDRAGSGYTSNNYFTNMIDWREHIEVWRMYSSGQFIHYLALYEDWSTNMIEYFDRHKILEIIMALYRITEVYIFIKNLSDDKLIGNDITLTLELHDVNDRVLKFYPQPFKNPRWLDYEYKCKMDYPIVIKKQLEANTIISDYESLAMNTTIELFTRFNWKSSQIDRLLKKDQEDFIRGL